MEPVFSYSTYIHSPLYDRRLMILILKKTNGRRSFSETCRSHKIKEEHRDRQNEPNAKTQRQTKYKQKETQEDFRYTETYTDVSTE
jgi:hypothetical protein